MVIAGTRLGRYPLPRSLKMISLTLLPVSSTPAGIVTLAMILAPIGLVTLVLSIRWPNAMDSVPWNAILVCVFK